MLDVEETDVCDLRCLPEKHLSDLGQLAISNDEVGVVTLAAGLKSLDTGCRCMQALHPFPILGKHRSFLEVHLAKNRKTSSQYGTRYHISLPQAISQIARYEIGSPQKVIITTTRRFTSQQDKASACEQYP